MGISKITTDELRRMKGKEGLVLQGCGGNTQEWLDGINDMLTKRNILLDGTKFEDCSVFEHQNITCILFPFDDKVKMDMGRLAIWRIDSNAVFGSTWLSDFVPNKLGGFIEEQAEKKAEYTKKPDCPLIGQDGNIFNLMGLAARTLRENDMAEQATEMCSRIRASGSYDQALMIIDEYVNITSVDDEIDEDEDEDECFDEDEDEDFDIGDIQP